MSYDYKYITVYIDTDGLLLGVPCGKSKKYDIAGLDLIFTLKPPYNDDELESFLQMILDKCYSEPCKDDTITSIEKHYRVKGYGKATKNLKMILVQWLKKEGYSVTPTRNSGKSCFLHLEDKIGRVETKYNCGDMAKAFRKALELAE